MVSENISNKLKIFVRYPPGASGHFISFLILSLTKDIKLVESHRAHKNINEINQGHNFYNQWTPEFNKHTQTDIDLEKSINWVRQTYDFMPTENELYVIHTHAIDPTPLMLAFDNTKLINITIKENDRDQIHYNWVTKSAYLYHEQLKMFNTALAKMQINQNKLKNIPVGSINKFTDLKLVTYIQKYAMLESWCFNFFEPVESNLYSVYNINFSDIANKKIIDLLDEIINFLGIKVTQERKEEAIRLLTEYADAQTPVPWKLTLEDYD